MIPKRRALNLSVIFARKGEEGEIALGCLAQIFKCVYN